MASTHPLSPDHLDILARVWLDAHNQDPCATLRDYEGWHRGAWARVRPIAPDADECEATISHPLGGVSHYILTVDDLVRVYCTARRLEARLTTTRGA